MCKNLVSWLARKQEFDQTNYIFVKSAVFCEIFFNENTAKLVMNNAVCEKL